MKRFTGAAATSAVTERELKNKEIAYRAAAEGIVLLKNDGVLPIKPGKLALFGAGAGFTVKGGTGSGEVNERHSVTILEGLKDAGFEITSEEWLEDYEDDFYDAKPGKTGLTLDVVNMLKAPELPVGRLIEEDDVDEETETAVYIIARQAGEGGERHLDKFDFDLQDTEVENLRFLTEYYDHTILVINTGSSMSLSKIKDLDISAVLFLGQPGQEGGRALADVLTGVINPSGKLTDTWVKDYKDVPCGDSYSYLAEDLKEQYYREGIYVGYRYYDTFQVKPAYHFGYGLSYTTFDFTASAFYLDVQGQRIRGSVTIKNTGKVSGREVAQVYVSCPDGKMKKEYQRLVAFAKTRELLPGEEETLDVSFSFKTMASYDERRASWILEKGNYIVRFGNASNNTKVSVVMHLNRHAYVSRVKNLVKPIRPIEEITPVVREITDDLTNIPVLSLTAQEVVCDTVSYNDPAPYSDDKVDAVMARLTQDDMIDVCVGAGIGGMTSTEKIYVPGTVGRTTDKLYNKGLINVNLSDGPAGLRILQVSALTKKGKLKFLKGHSMLSVMDTLPGFLTKPFMAKEDAKDVTLQYQYCTAFPSGTVIAQTFDTAIARQVGEAISAEMDDYFITYWLGPAMNIHRNPLCGRNFEYMSEDPLVTGKIASAMIQGVQSIDGNYATIKHFACNNAEEDRNHSNSHVNERALREIYLRGFEIAVKEGHVASVMSSYNKLNEIYTPNHYELLTCILRNEWGFDGVVMTDWFSTAPGLAKAGTALHAGNDMIMAGLPMDKSDIKKALKDGRLSPLDLRRCAANIVRQILYSHVAEQVKPEMFD